MHGVDVVQLREGRRGRVNERMLHFPKKALPLFAYLALRLRLF